MGRAKKKVPGAAILEMRTQGKSIKDISKELNVSTATLSRRIAELSREHGVLTKYRELQGLHLSMHQFRILEAISPLKVAECSLSELLHCFHLLKKTEAAIQGKSSLKVSGLLSYLKALE